MMRSQANSSSRARPYFVGVVGGTGSGKTTVARGVAEGLPSSRVSIISHDSYYRSRVDLSPLQRSKINFDHPHALDNRLLISHLDALREGRDIESPSYDFATHLRSEQTRRIQPTPVIIVEGILLLADPQIRERLDLALYVDTDADIRILRRIRRDIESRGRSFNDVCAQYHESVRPMHEQFVEPTKRWADIIIPEGGENKNAIDLIVGYLERQTR